MRSKRQATLVASVALNLLLLLAWMTQGQHSDRLPSRRTGLLEQQGQQRLAGEADVRVRLERTEALLHRMEGETQARRVLRGAAAAAAAPSHRAACPPPAPPLDPAAPLRRR